MGGYARHHLSDQIENRAARNDDGFQDEDETRSDCLVEVDLATSNAIENRQNNCLLSLRSKVSMFMLSELNANTAENRSLVACLLRENKMRR